MAKKKKKIDIHTCMYNGRKNTTYTVDNERLRNTNPTKIAIYRSSPETVFLICSFMQFMFNQV